MPILVVCQKCKSKLKAPDVMAGRMTKCPKCSIQILVEEDRNTENSSQQIKLDIPSLESSKVKKEKFSEEIASPNLALQNVQPILITQVNLVNQKPAQYKDCSFCGEEILMVAKKCKHCGETLDIALRIAEDARRVAENSNHSPAVSAVASTTVIIQNNNPQYVTIGFPHFIHFLLTLFTGGLWLPIWILLYIFRSK